MKGPEEKLANVGAKAVNYMTSFNEVESMAQFTAFGLHQCPTCGKITQWQGQPPGKCWCESLTERVVALEAWKAEMLNHAISVMMTPPSKAESGQPIGYDQRPLASEPEIPMPSDERLQVINEMRRADFRNGEASMNLVADAVKALQERASSTEIDWGKVRSSSIQALCTPDNPFAHCKAAVAEYLRQVKEGGK